MHYLSPAESAEIVRLFQEEGKSLKDLAKLFDICEATVYNHVHGRTNPRALRKKKIRPKKATVINLYASSACEEMDFSTLPDDVLFVHVRECNFIG